jgi:DNA replication protein DnaC
MTTDGGKPLADVLSSLDIPVPALSEEQWAARDATCAAAREREAARDRERGVRERIESLRAAGHSERALLTIQRPDLDLTSPALAHMRTWDPTGPTEKNILVLSGPVGTGKSVAVTWWAAQQGRTPVCVTAMTFARQSRYDSRRDDLLTAPALILDDLGSEFVDDKGSFLVDLDELIDTYYRALRPLVITTNCTVDVFRARYGTRVFDRLLESGEFYAVGGPSLRGRRGGGTATGAASQAPQSQGSRRAG